MRALLLPALALLLVATPGQAQDRETERRVDRLEREIRALQRQVFPGGDSEFFEPEIRPGQTTTPGGSPVAGPITDLTDRVNALEAALARLTGQVEENSYELRQLRSMIEGLEAPPPALDETISTREIPRAEPDPEPAPVETAEPAPLPADAPFRSEGAEPPLPDDPGEAAYVRGYRLWRDGRYEEARTQLESTIEQYPGHRFESYARNLLGRAFLDDDKPANATEIFVRNYQDLPNGERAADSLFFLGVALTELNYPDRACLAFDELEDVYGSTLRSTIREQVPAARQAARCR